MGSEVVILLAVLAIALSGAGTLLIARPRFLAGPRRESVAMPNAEPGESPVLSVIIPARNEAHNLPKLLQSLQAARQAVAGELEVIVVDDGSSDDTAAVARAHGAEVLVVADKPGDWLGKAWACALGAQHAQAEQLCFLDADTVLAPTSLREGLALRASLGGALMVQPRHAPESAGEQLSAYFNVVVVAGTGAFLPWEAPARSGFGPAIFLDRRDYEAIGGHTAARHAVLEDVALADALRAGGIPVHLRLGGAALRFRMYPGGLGQLAEGFAKGMASGASSAPPVVTFLFSLWLSGGFLAIATLATLPLAPSLWPWATAAWLAASLSLALQLRAVGRFSAWVWLLFPIPLVFFVGLFARSAWSTHVRKEVVWKGRPIATQRPST